MDTARSPHAEAWIASGAADLTGRPDGPPLVAPDTTVRAIRALGEPIGVDPLPLLAERAAIAGLRRGGATSCGGATRLLEATDGWVALSLARPDDVDLLPAFLGIAAEPDWAAVAASVADRTSEDLRTGAALLGLPLGVLGERARSRSSRDDPCLPREAARSAGQRAVVATTIEPRDAAPPLDRAPVVVDLSSLWAGPLCGRLLGERGAHVIKVESSTRPDGARAGSPRFYEVLNGTKQQCTVDFAAPAALRTLLLDADVVIEGSRPRALEQLGIVAAEIVRHGPRVWVSITGHGRDADHRDRVGFGDDAAVAGGLVADDGAGPCFVADAVADPLTGVAAAAAVTEALAAGGRWLLDVALTGVAAAVAQPGPPWAAATG